MRFCDFCLVRLRVSRRIFSNSAPSDAQIRPLKVILRKNRPDFVRRDPHPGCKALITASTSRPTADRFECHRHSIFDIRYSIFELPRPLSRLISAELPNGLRRIYDFLEYIYFFSWALARPWWTSLFTATRSHIYIHVHTRTHMYYGQMRYKLISCSLFHRSFCDFQVPQVLMLSERCVRSGAADNITSKNKCIHGGLWLGARLQQFRAMISLLCR